MSMQKQQQVLLVEDASDMQLMVSAAIGDICRLKSVTNLADAERELAANSYSLLILDVNLPDGDGFDFCSRLRGRADLADLPIIFLTGEAALESRLKGFNLGADDYVTKPLEPTEFTARVTAKLKRGAKVPSGFTRSGYRVDLSAHKAFQIENDGSERQLPLTPIEFKLFSHFLQNEEKIYSRQDLLKLFWDKDVHVSGHTVDTHLSSLRKKLGPAGMYIRSVFKKAIASRLPRNGCNPRLSATLQAQRRRRAPRSDLRLLLYQYNTSIKSV